MHLLNYKYTNSAALQTFIKKNGICDSQTVLIQLFYSKIDEQELYVLRDTLHSFLPNSKLMASSTAGVVGDGLIQESVIWISFSIFESSSMKLGILQHTDTQEDLLKLLFSLVHSRTKLLLCFANTSNQRVEETLQIVTKIYPKLVLAGGNSGDDFKFEGAKVFTYDTDDCALAFVAIDSDELEVQTRSLFNWQAIGKAMKVSRSSGERVYEINGENIFDIYEKYLGSDVSENILKYGIEFPLIMKHNKGQIARAIVNANKQEGWIEFGGTLPQGSDVRFGFINIENMKKDNSALLDQDRCYENEGAYVFVCAARRKVLGSYIDAEIQALQEIAPLSGFVSYGEFYHDQTNATNTLCNNTTLYITLNEKCTKAVSCEPKEEQVESKRQNIHLKALSHLLHKTSEELEENIHYLQQFKKSVEEASIFSITDAKGNIKEVNKNFVNISGYTQEELIGKPHNIVRHEDMPNEAFKEMWQTIKAGNIWKGMVKNKTKDGHAYYVISEITPIYNKDGSFREYIGIRNDVTELEEYKNLLRHELDSTSENLQDNLSYTRQYEDAINSTIAVIKTDKENKITYANKKFCDLSGYDTQEILFRDCTEFLHQKHRDSNLCTKIMQNLAQKKSIKHTLTNKAKDGSEYITDTLFSPILHRDGTVMEHLQMMHDVTEISLLNQEIIDTQKEVVLIMGAIGETRSKETGLHVRRVAEYSYLLAKLAGMSEKEASLLKQASPMHDIGKVGIPDSILNKPAKLTDQEFELMTSHTTIGYEMLKHSNRAILKASAQVALTHHEKYDGSGYPKGLKAENIPIYGRITAIADVFDALGNERCYKQAWELDRILDLFKKESAKHFDPNLLELFFENLDQFLLISDQFQD